MRSDAGSAPSSQLDQHTHRGELVAGQLFLQSTTLFLQHCVIQVVFQPKYSNIVESTGGELVKWSPLFLSPNWRLQSTALIL